MDLLECQAIVSLYSYKRDGKVIVDLKIFQISFKLDSFVIMTCLEIIVCIYFRSICVKVSKQLRPGYLVYQPLNGAVQEYLTASRVLVYP